MFGKIDCTHLPVIPALAIILASFIAIVTDLKSGKIFNWLTLPTLGIGILSSFIYYGWWGLGEALLAGVAGLVLYGWMFGLRILGGGDVKLLMALGACGGIKFTLQVAVLGLILGGLMAVLVLLINGRLRSFLSRLYWFLMSIFVPELEVQPLKVDQSLTMPFGIPIAIAAVWTIFGSPLVYLGLSL